MMLHGWCWKCRKVKRVKVDVASLAKGNPIGVCRECEEERTEMKEAATFYQSKKFDREFGPADGLGD